MKQFLSICLLLFAVNNIHAQAKISLQGKVTDSTGHPIRQASVSVLNTGLGAVTGDDGQFRIASIPRGKYTVSISAIGYATQLVEISTEESGKPLSLVISPSFGKLDEVVVSAEKSESRLMRLPLSVSALNRRQVAELRLWDLSQITAVIPNLNSANSGDNRNVTFIRGVGTTSYEQAVSTYIDGVSQFTLDAYIPQLFDVERIEVLRGPQGTLYGRNAMGGVVNIITRQPSNRPDWHAEISAGNFGEQRYLGAFRFPLVKDKLYFGIAGMYEKRNGYYRNVYYNNDFDRLHQSLGNYFLKYIASSRFNMTLNVKHLGVKNNGPFPLATDKASAFQQPYQVNQNAVTEMHDNTLNGSLSLQYTAPAFRFNAQTAYQSNYRVYKNPIDGDFSPLDAISINNDYGKSANFIQVFTQEIRFNSRDEQGRKLNWSAGAYGFLQDNPAKQGTVFGKDAPLLGIPDSNFTIISTNNGKNRGVAFFGQATYPIVHALELTAGLRYDLESRELKVAGDYQPKGGPVIPVRPDTSSKKNFNAVSPKLGLNWKISAGQQLFLVYARGYRAGGFTSLSSDPSQPPLSAYNPEYSNNIELGWKKTGMNQRFRIQASIFYTFNDQVQVPTLLLPDAITVIRNAGRMESKGAEIEILSTPVKGLEMGYSGGVTDARYSILKLPVNGVEEDFKNNRQIFTPSFTSFLYAQYSHVIRTSSQIRLVGRFEWAQLGKQYFDLANQLSQEGYGLLHARIGVQAPGFSVFFWARNLSDTRYITYGYDFGGVHLGNPRTYGLTLQINR